MTPALLESPPSLFAEVHRGGPAGGRGGMTLEECLERTLRAVHAEGVTDCPMCGSSMSPEGGAGRCTGCRTTLA